MADFASEAGHWYDKQGNPCYTQVKKDGGIRNTTLRDARKLNLVPSVTTIMQEINKPQLEMWKIKQAVTQARKMRKRKDETDDQFAVRAYYESQQQVRDRADSGSVVHGALERYFLGEPYDEEYDVYVAGVVKCLNDLELGGEEWMCEKSFATDSFGGKVDLHSPNIVADFKTKEFDADSLPKAYDNHLIQLGAYRKGLQLPNVGGLILFVSVDNPGLVHPVMCTPEELTKGYAIFDGLLKVWQAKRGFGG